MYHRQTIYRPSLQQRVWRVLLGLSRQVSQHLVYLLRVGSSCPSLLLRGGEVVLALGSGGSKRIRTALAQVISNVVDFGMDPWEAVEAPRVHWDGEQVQAEPGFPPAALEALADRWSVNRWDDRNLYFGGVHAVAPGREGAGDPRRGGSVVLC